jgi:hypothetical protein
VHAILLRDVLDARRGRSCLLSGEVSFHRCAFVRRRFIGFGEGPCLCLANLLGHEDWPYPYGLGGCASEGGQLHRLAIFGGEFSASNDEAVVYWQTTP